MTDTGSMTLITSIRLLHSLRKMHVILETLLSSVTPEHAQRTPADPKEWSIIEILCHLRDYENIFFQRARLILQEEYLPFSVPESNEVMAARGQYKQQELSSVLASLSTTRQEFIQVLSNIQEEQWMRKGIRHDGTPVTLKEVVFLVIVHEIDHVEQITHLL